MKPTTKIQKTGEQPSRRPPEDEPERVGEGELDIGPPAGSVDARDEDAATTDQPLRDDSPRVDSLHPSRQAALGLSPGSGGDAARPGKEGTSGKPVPPREDVE